MLAECSIEEWKVPLGQSWPSERNAVTVGIKKASEVHLQTRTIAAVRNFVNHAFHVGAGRNRELGTDRHREPDESANGVSLPARFTRNRAGQRKRIRVPAGIVIV